MSYYYSKVVNLSYDQAIEAVTKELQKEGFGILTQIDVRETLKKKLGVDFPHYKILGACNPNFAHQALLAEDKIGTMLPCNVIVQEKGELAEVSAIDPVASMMAVNNQALNDIVPQVAQKLRKVIERL